MNFVLTDWLTDWLTPSDKRNLITAIATGCTALISSLLFNIASSQDVPFCQPQQLQCSHHGSTKTYLCSPLYCIHFSLSAKVMICSTRVMASVVSVVQAGVLLALFFAWTVNQTFEELETKRSVMIYRHTHFYTNSLGRALWRSCIPYFYNGWFDCRDAFHVVY